MGSRFSKVRHFRVCLSLFCHAHACAAQDDPCRTDSGAWSCPSREIPTISSLGRLSSHPRWLVLEPPLGPFGCLQSPGPGASCSRRHRAVSVLTSFRRAPPLSPMPGLPGVRCVWTDGGDASFHVVRLSGGPPKLVLEFGRQDTTVASLQLHYGCISYRICFVNCKHSDHAQGRESSSDQGGHSQN